MLPWIAVAPVGLPFGAQLPSLTPTGLDYRFTRFHRFAAITRYVEFTFTLVPVGYVEPHPVAVTLVIPLRLQLDTHHTLCRLHTYLGCYVALILVVPFTGFARWLPSSPHHLYTQLHLITLVDLDYPCDLVVHLCPLDCLLHTGLDGHTFPTPHYLAWVTRLDWFRVPIHHTLQPTPRWFPLVTLPAIYTHAPVPPCPVAPRLLRLDLVTVAVGLRYATGFATGCYTPSTWTLPSHTFVGLGLPHTGCPCHTGYTPHPTHAPHLGLPPHTWLVPHLAHTVGLQLFWFTVAPRLVYPCPLVIALVTTQLPLLVTRLGWIALDLPVGLRCWIPSHPRICCPHDVPTHPLLGLFL